MSLIKKNSNVLLSAASIVLAAIGVTSLNNLESNEKMNNVDPAKSSITEVTAEQPVKPTKLYNPSTTNASNQQIEWAESRPLDAQKLSAITSTPTSIWLTKNTPEIATYVADKIAESSSQEATPVFVVYNIPLRHCDGGGASNLEEYKLWIRQIQAAIDTNRAILIIEPDALALMDCISQADQQLRYDALVYALDTFSPNPNVDVYIDAGHSDWVDRKIIASRLSKVGINKIKGFSLNVSNFQQNDELIKYGQDIRDLLGKTPTFIIDSSRNGVGPPTDRNWCNPRNRALGTKPVIGTNTEGLDGYLWIKFPGESDGTCNNGPNEGNWWPEYALELIDNIPN